MEYRLYSFVNYYLSSIQQGIQTGHAAVKLVREYTSKNQDNQDSQMVSEWADNHQTFVVLNGGNSENLLDVIRTVDDSDLPWAYFREDEVSLGGIITAVGVIVPEIYFNVKIEKDALGNPYYPANPVDGCYYNPICIGHSKYELVKMIKTARLAQ
jgi:hypothetical protein